MTRIDPKFEHYKTNPGCCKLFLNDLLSVNNFINNTSTTEQTTFENMSENTYYIK